MSDPTFPQPPADHGVKIPHLVFGLLFLGIAGIWALVASDVINTDRLAILAPAVLIVAGVVGLAVSLASGRNRRGQHTPEHDTVGHPDETTEHPLVDDEPTKEIR